MLKTENTFEAIFLVCFLAGSVIQMMLEQFGDEYRQYMARSGRLLPRRHTRYEF